MNTISIRAGIRRGLTKGERNSIRKSGAVLAVLYGQKRESTPILIEPVSVKEINAHHSHGLVEIRLQDDEPIHALIQQVERDPLTKQLIHLDFHAISLDEPVEITLPIFFLGMEKVEKSGGVIQQQERELVIRALPRQIPEHILLDISSLRIGQSLTAIQVPLPEGCTLVSEPDELIVAVLEPRAAVAEEEQAGAEVEAQSNG